MLVATSILLSRQKTYLSRQKYVTKITFVADKVLSRQNATKDVFCRDKSCVGTKMILVAAPANDRSLLSSVDSFSAVYGSN